MNSRTSVKTAGARRRRRRPARAEDDRLDRLWHRYTTRVDIESRNALIEAYMPIVQREARKIVAALSHSVPSQELESAGTLGLIDSIDNFDPSHGFRFVTFCTPRVRGAMLDELRSWDWTPRATRAKLNKLERVIHKLEGRLGRSPHLDEVAGELDLSENEVRRLFHDRSRTLVSLDTPTTRWSEHGRAQADPPTAHLEDKRGIDPVRHLQKKEVAEAVRRILTQTERLVITLYYYEQFNLREIGRVLRLTESRICQIHGDIVRRLKKHFL